MIIQIVNIYAQPHTTHETVSQLLRPFLRPRGKSAGRRSRETGQRRSTETGPKTKSLEIAKNRQSSFARELQFELP